jgi:FHS family glucose/mannose:H+ symporter-like MFS transporter
MTMVVDLLRAKRMKSNMRLWLEMRNVELRWSYVLFAYASLFALGFLDNARGPFFPLVLRDLDLTDTSGSWLFSVTSLLSFMASYSCRWLIPLAGSIRVLRGSLFFLGLGFVGLGLGGNYFSVLLASGVLGIGQGIGSVAQHVLIQESSPESHWRRLFSGLHSNYGMASFFAPLIFSYAIGLSYPWTKIVFLFSGIPFIILIFSFFYFSKGRGLRNLPMSSSRDKGIGKETSLEGRDESTSNGGFQRILSLWMAMILATYLVGELSLTTRMVLYLKRVTQWSDASSAKALTCFFLLMFLSRLVFFVGPGPLKSSGRHVLSYCLIFSSLFYSLGLIYHPVFLVLCGLSLGPFFPVFIETIAQVFGKQASRAFSVAISFGTLMTVIMHYGLGRLSDEMGIQVALWLGPLALLSSFLILSILVTKNPFSHLRNLTSKP